MGQRFQTVFILPKIYMNQDNPNNRDKKVIVYHNQWLYGFTAIRLNLDIMKRIKESINKRSKCGSYGKSKKDFINHFLEKSIKNAICYCSLKDLHNESHFSESANFEFKDFENLGQELLREDNNNGFFICEINDDLDLSYSFISGTEDTDINKIMDPLKYLKLFYSDDKIKEFSEKDKKLLERTIKGYLKFQGMNLFNLSKTVKVMNEKRIVYN